MFAWAMSLWDVLIAASSAAFVGAALAAARVTNGGARAYVVATLTGMLLAVANVWAWSHVAAAVDNQIKSFSESLQERYLRWLYVGAAIWIVCAGAAGGWIALRVLRLVF